MAFFIGDWLTTARSNPSHVFLLNLELGSNLYVVNCYDVICLVDVVRLVDLVERNSYIHIPVGRSRWNPRPIWNHGNEVHFSGIWPYWLLFLGTQLTPFFCLVHSAQGWEVDPRLVATSWWDSSLGTMDFCIGRVQDAAAGQGAKVSGLGWLYHQLLICEND